MIVKTGSRVREETREENLEEVEAVKNIAAAVGRHINDDARFVGFKCLLDDLGGGLVFGKCVRAEAGDEHNDGVGEIVFEQFVARHLIVWIPNVRLWIGGWACGSRWGETDGALSDSVASDLPAPPLLELAGEGRQYSSKRDCPSVELKLKPEKRATMSTSIDDPMVNSMMLTACPGRRPPFEAKAPRPLLPAAI